MRVVARTASSSPRAGLAILDEYSGKGVGSLVLMNNEQLGDVNRQAIIIVIIITTHISSRGRGGFVRCDLFHGLM